ncbi:MAG TPA: hypothetical protein VNV38_20935 [Stellaceae bacterium]|jgi:hypothetical protein|nr:hypothetical protein [Stellaceae bacterium]
MIRLLAYALFLGLVVAGCAQSGGNSANDNNNNRFGGFYGGVSGGDMGP